MSKPLHLFEGFGIELEYMIVDRDTLKVLPIADELLKSMTGEDTGDFENGMVTWSNELVLHLIELKCTKPESDLVTLEKEFCANVTQINKQLDKWNAMLLPTAAHPSMNPLVETKLWPHDNNKIYERYNTMFDCKGHGWANLQSTHLNLPFNGDDEFGRLHAAIRVLLPLLPALCASSTVLDGKFTDHPDARMLYYKSNQKAIPSITGKVIPEPVFTEADHDKYIYQIIAKDIEPFNADGILDPVFVNSRGAMSRFDRGSIEIRVMDIQECPAVDIAIQRFVIEILRLLVSEKLSTYEHQKKMETDVLASILDETISEGMNIDVENDRYLQIFGLQKGGSVRDVLQKLLGSTQRQPWRKIIQEILDRGNLSTRIRKALNHNPSPASIQQTWKRLADCLQDNTMFIP